MDFRKDINGLRAIAVVAVILFHFNAAWLPGGFAGVDVFFVISGYLMTSIIYRGLANNSLSIPKFYLARGRRIVPALLLPCTILLIFGWFYFLPQEFLELGKHVAASLAFVSNVTYWTESGYFAAGAHQKWLLHTWSLSVEWQFYMLYPVVLYLLSKAFRLSWLRWLVLIGAIAGFALSVYASPRWPEAAFFLLPTRAWEMMVGGLVYLFPATSLKGLRPHIVLLGLLLIALSYVFFSESDIWPGYLAIIPVAGAALVLAANTQDSIYTNNPVSQWLGNISYSLYIWHWPTVVCLSYLGLLDSLVYQLAGIGISLAIAQLSYSFIEQRMRTLIEMRWSVRWIAYASVLCGAGTVVFLTNGVIGEVRPASISDKAQFVAQYQEKYLKLADTHWISKCNFMSALKDHGILKTDEVCTKKQGAGGLFLWGDSHAEALSYGLRHALPTGVPFYQVTSSGCRPSLHDDVKQKGIGKIACTYSNKFAIQKINELRPDIVVLGQKDNHELTDWEEIATALKSAGVKQVVLVGPTPQWQPSLPVVIVNRHWADFGDQIHDTALDKKTLRTNALLSRKTKGEDLTFVSLIDKLCAGDNCQARVPPSRSLLLVDYGHLSAEGSSYVVQNIVLPQLKLR